MNPIGFRANKGTTYIKRSGGSVCALTYYSLSLPSSPSLPQPTVPLSEGWTCFALSNLLKFWPLYWTCFAPPSLVLVKAVVATIFHFGFHLNHVVLLVFGFHLNPVVGFAFRFRPNLIVGIAFGFHLNLTLTGPTWTLWWLALFLGSGVNPVMVGFTFGFRLIPRFRSRCRQGDPFFFFFI